VGLGQRLALTGQRSTLNGPRPGSVGPGLGRIWAGLGQAGPATCQALVLPRHLNGFNIRFRLVSLAHGGLARMVHGFERGPRWTQSTLFSSPSAHGAPSSPSRFSAPLSLLPLLGRALTGGERPSSRSGGSRAKLVGSRAPRGLKELNRGVNGAD
jgi:hypothetical protein